MLIGLPGVGKSYWVANQTVISNYDVISSDRYIDEYAKSVNKTYNDVFDDYVSVASKLLDIDLNESIINRRNIIWDQTNLTSSSRIKKLSKLTNYHKIAMVFDTPDEATHKLQLSRPGKVISTRLLFQMKDNYQPPTLDEGFDEIAKPW
jgi:predicted kinase